MASRKMFFGSKPRYIYPAMEFGDGNLIPSFDHHHHHHNSPFEFDEVDVWNNCNDPATTNSEPRKPLPSSRASSKKLFKISDNNKHRSPHMAAASASLPVNIPDWSKILKAEYKEHEKTVEDTVGGGEDDDDDGRVPPHEYLARMRGASFSVHEGIGRTLKGRDLRRVRNAVWKKTGFED
ncbi:hypothetical protein like AT5G03230 [Hibiscus trionum]|uniref:Senescence regulator n=1 Tax=Hibiscus trionum TaxID=183268 RepID=A0A9W7LPF0_HIBTR|nr:hypothetical protein like AT5G03230 [Hibiscus trionum]